MELRVLAPPGGGVGVGTQGDTVSNPDWVLQGEGVLLAEDVTVPPPPATAASEAVGERVGVRVGVGMADFVPAPERLPMPALRVVLGLVERVANWVPEGDTLMLESLFKEGEMEEVRVVEKVLPPPPPPPILVVGDTEMEGEGGLVGWEVEEVEGKAVDVEPPPPPPLPPPDPVGVVEGLFAALTLPLPLPPPTPPPAEEGLGESVTDGVWLTLPEAPTEPLCSPEPLKAAGLGEVLMERLPLSVPLAAPPLPPTPVGVAVGGGVRVEPPPPTPVGDPDAEGGREAGGESVMVRERGGD